MKVILKCNYGKNSPGDIVDLSKEKAQKLIDEGAANQVDQDASLTAGELKVQHAALKKQVAGLEKANEALTAEKTALEAKVSELEKAAK